jgi:tetratricopeptide (TPR) repeat protein
VRLKILDSTAPVMNERLVAIGAEDVERALLEQLAAAGDDPVGAMWELAQFYKLEGKLDKALECFRALLQRVGDAEAQAGIWLGMGQAAERAADFELAEVFYRQGLLLGPRDEFTQYYLNNNLGYSLNRVGRHAAAEAYCRRAIDIDPARHNAHKNLGLSLQGQRRYAEAASEFVTAAKANALDPRALRHLESLLEAQPRVAAEFAAELETVRRVVRRTLQ